MPDQDTSLADGRYTLQETIGSGGMATVYRGFDQRLQVTRAVKILNEAFTTKTRIRARFEAEARTMAVLDHANIVRVYDVGSEGDTVYIVMELVEGESLLDRIEGAGPISAIDALQITRDMLSGLQAAHAQAIVHRDIKPHNILLSTEGRVRITDFGIARSMHLTEESFTKTGAVMGTWAFMAPEQRVNSKGVDFRADIYGTGATLFAMVTKRTPMDLFAADLDPVMLRDVPEIVLPIIRKATRYQPDERYADAHEMLEAVDKILSQAPTRPQTIRTPPPTSTVPLPEQARTPPPVEATFLPDGAGGLLSTGSLEPTASAPPPPVVPPALTDTEAPALEIGVDTGTLLPDDEIAAIDPEPGSILRTRIVTGLVAALVLIALGTFGSWVTHPGIWKTNPSPQPESPASPEQPTQQQAAPADPTPAAPAPDKAEERKADREPEPRAPEPEDEDEDEDEDVGEDEEEAVEPPVAELAPGEGLRLIASPPRSGTVGQRLTFSARIPAASIKEHRSYTVRMSYRTSGESYKPLILKREGKVWQGSLLVTREMTAGLEWCMFAKPNPSTLPEHPKLTAVACNAPRRVSIRSR